MSRQFAVKILKEKGQVIIKANGNSMSPIMYKGDSLYLKKVSPLKLRKGDAVFCKVKGNLTVHLISYINKDNKTFQISNNHGFVNGIIGANSIYGLCVQVNDKSIISSTELNNRNEY